MGGNQMIYEYNHDEKYIKIDDRIVHLTNSENKIFNRIQKNGYITPEEVNEILAKGHATRYAIDSFMNRMSFKIFRKGWDWK